MKVNLSIVEERTEESEDFDDIENSQSKISNYQSKINFDKLSKGTEVELKDWSENRFLRIKDLKKNYIVHYIDKLGTDFRLALEFLKRTKTLSICLETKNEPCTPSYLQIACRRRCYVFNLFKIKQNEEFLDFLSEILASKKILKIVFENKKFVSNIKNTFKLSRKLIKFNNFFSVKKSLYVSKTSKTDLSICCQRLFGKLLIFTLKKLKNRTRFLRHGWPAQRT